jgi:hypothetical protein
LDKDDARALGGDAAAKLTAETGVHAKNPRA